MKQGIFKVILITMVTTALSSNVIGETNAEWEASLLGSDTFWGASTNGVKSALNIEALSVANPLIRCTPILKNTNNGYLLMYLPPLKSRFIMELKDSNGTAVEKTQMGKALNEALAEPFGLTTGINTRAGYGRLPSLRPNYSEKLDGYAFNLQDYFVITNSGTYNLAIQLRVIWFLTPWKGSLKTTHVPVVNLPAVNARIDVKFPKPQINMKGSVP